MKFYSEISGILIYADNIKVKDIFGGELLKYKKEILEKIESLKLPLEKEKGLLIYTDNELIKEFVKSIKLNIVEKNKKLYLEIVVVTIKQPTKYQYNELLEELRWILMTENNYNIENTEIKVDDGKLYICFYNMYEKLSLLKEEEI
ncbi:hypothetical protein [uncultured Tyzzerella sp.]|uniref:hypothetical protein n=1 Tax=uncultured Tyzzerella sp. TaxID=2321398 RepID=UPI002943013C|nr:hypothetical protein [uncultured Tyzzerella sp.]